MNLLNENEAAQLLGFKVATLRAWRVDRKGPRWAKLCGAVRYRREDLEKWVNENIIAPDDPVGNIAA